MTTDQYKAIAVQAAKKWGVPVQPFLRQLQQESGFRPGLTSSAGAKWIGQFIPSTARAYGVHDDVSSIWGAAHYMADNLKAYGTMERALSAYNSGRADAYKDPNFAGGQTYRYVRSIMGGANVDVGTATAPASGEPTPDPGTAPPAPGEDLAAQAADRAKQIKQTATASLRGIAAGEFKPTEGLANIASLVTTLRATPLTAAAVQPTTQEPPTSSSQPSGGDVSQWVSLGAGADRSGVTTAQSVLNFVGQIGQLAGTKLTIGTGTSHNQYVAGTHRESQHWQGHAADIPASGDELTRIGRLALIAAGMSRERAMKQKGGVFNIGKYQILFNTLTGGNHYNHLHVGVR